MNLQQRIRTWLGLDKLDQIGQIAYDVYAIDSRMRELTARISLLTTAQARIIAKLDPAYGKDMHSQPARDESDAIACRVLSTMSGEQAARNNTGGPVV